MISSSKGYYGKYGGRFVPETLIAPLDKLNQAFQSIIDDATFWDEYHRHSHEYIGRPTPLTYAKRLSQHYGGAQLYLKREDLNHTGAHKINNALGQALLAKRMGKSRLIAETGAGMHGVATATVAAYFGLECHVYMGAVDVERQAPNVSRMQMLGAEIHSVDSGSKTLKDAMNEALRDWVTNVDNTFYIIGSVAGPHPYPQMVKKFVSIIGAELKQQLNGMPVDGIVACVGGGSNAMGIFAPFLEDSQVKLFGVEAAGTGLQHAASIHEGKVGVLHGSKTYLLQNEHGQITEAHSISAGLDYPGVGPEHSYLNDIGRVSYVGITDAEAVEAAFLTARLEGIIPALETAHALAQAFKLVAELPTTANLVVNLSGRGDKDLHTLLNYQST